jgi:hypothetical protein
MVRYTTVSGFLKTLPEVIEFDANAEGTPVLLKVFEEKTSGKLATGDRPDLLNALGYIREGDLLSRPQDPRRRPARRRRGQPPLTSPPTLENVVPLPQIPTGAPLALAVSHTDR